MRCVAPTLIQEPGAGARAIEDKRAELAAVSALPPLTADEVAEIRAIGDNTGSMALKGAAPDFDGAAAADRWPLTDELSELAGRWGIDPARDLVEGAKGQTADDGSVRFALLSAIPLALAAAPASAHELSAGHSDRRGELAFADVAGTVETVDRAAGTEDQGLPLTWCGDERTSDDVLHARNAPTLAQFKVVYAYASDRPSRFAAWKDALQADVSLISRFMGAQSGGRKAPRFDMGTSCGPDYVDVQVVALPGARATYANNLAALKSAVAAQVPAVLGEPRNTIVLADRMSNTPAGYWTGIGESYVSEARGSSSPHNNGGLFAALWVPDAEAAPGASPDGWWAEGMLHELSHNLGAVGDSAPHSSGFGHCFDGYDVMCYPDDPAAPAMTYPCPRTPRAHPPDRDRPRRDDTSTRRPPPALPATHWNVYDNGSSPLCADIMPACGRRSRQAPSPSLTIAFQIARRPPARRRDPRAAAARPLPAAPLHHGRRDALRAPHADRRPQRPALRLPALSVGVPAGTAGRVSYTLRATRGIFSALTAKSAGRRPAARPVAAYGPSSHACENVPRSKNSSRGAVATPWTWTVVDLARLAPARRIGCCRSGPVSAFCATPAARTSPAVESEWKPATSAAPMSNGCEPPRWPSSVTRRRRQRALDGLLERLEGGDARVDRVRSRRCGRSCRPTRRSCRARVRAGPVAAVCAACRLRVEQRALLGGRADPPVDRLQAGERAVGASRAAPAAGTRRGAGCPRWSPARTRRRWSSPPTAGCSSCRGSPACGSITFGRALTASSPRHSASPVPGNGSRSSQRFGRSGSRPGCHQPMLPPSSATSRFSFQVSFAAALPACCTVLASLSAERPTSVSISRPQIA